MTFFRKKKFLLFNGIVDEVHVDGDGVDGGDAVLDPAQHTQTTQLPLLTLQAFSSFYLFCIRTIVLVMEPQFCTKITTRLQLFIDSKLLYCKHCLLLSVLSSAYNIGPNFVQFLRNTAVSNKKIPSLHFTT